MVKENKLNRVKEMLKNAKLDHFENIPYDSKLDNIIFQGKSLGTLKQGPVINCVNNIINSIGG